MKRSNTFVIYDASAGSGKTFTLVKEYLILLLTSNRAESYRNILAITFTNKAVAEMKSRIVQGLRSLAGQDPEKKNDPLLQLLASETALSPEEIGKRSRKILRSILHDYASFEVSTIDGFTHRVLRTFARDLDLPLNFEVELHTDEVLNQAVDRVISKAGEDAALTRVLVQYTLGKTDEDRSWDIGKDMFSMAGLITNENHQKFLTLLKNNSLQDFEKLYRRLQGLLRKEEKRIGEAAEHFFLLIQTNGLRDSDFSRSSCPKFFKKLLDGNFDQRTDYQWQERISSHSLYSQSLAKDKKEILDRLQPEIVSLFQTVRDGIQKVQYLKGLEKNLVPLSLLSAIQDEIEIIKNENSMMMISEFNAAIAGAVKDQPAPFIYERLGERYKHYFIDEFQDTSELQWENLIPLVDHSLSSIHPKEEHGSLTLVGDAKQSIYRWRGGKAEQFMDLCRQKNPFSIENKEVIVLPKNFRSAGNIVRFNNDFFQFASTCFGKEVHRELFYKSSQEIVKEEEGYVNISFIEASSAEEELEEYPRRVGEILEQLEKRCVPKKAVCILTRKRKESIAVANYLSNLGIPVISAESLLIERSPEVGFITAVLRSSINPKDKNLKFEILDYILHQKNVQDHFKILQEVLPLENQAFFDALQPLGLFFQLDHFRSLSLYEAVEYVIRSFSLVKEPNAYLQFYLDFVHEAVHFEGIGIFEFLELWDRKKENLSIVVPQGEDAVQIMTIHKAKGLEFPVVIYPFANSKITDVARESLWVDLPEELDSEIQVAYLRATEKMKNWPGEAPQLYEEICHSSQLDALNVLYVALTRPVNELYIISKLEKPCKTESSRKFSHLFRSYLEKLGKWDESLEYHIGQVPEEAAFEQKRSESHSQQVTYSSSTQSNGISFVTRSGSLWDSKQEKAIEKGELVHELLARIHSIEDVQKALLEAKEEGRFDQKGMQSLADIVLKIVGHPLLEELFSPHLTSCNEQNLISPGGGILRPDRLVFNGEEVSILDYKTGEEKEYHVDQVEGYSQVLESMGFRVVDKLLIYVNEEVFVKRV